MKISKNKMLSELEFGERFFRWGEPYVFVGKTPFEDDDDFIIVEEGPKYNSTIKYYSTIKDQLVESEHAQMSVSSVEVGDEFKYNKHPTGCLFTVVAIVDNIAVLTHPADSPMGIESRTVTLKALINPEYYTWVNPDEGDEKDGEENE